MNPFMPMTYRGCANAKKEKFHPKGKYEYDVFYIENGEQCTGYTKGDNQEHAKENFYAQYGDSIKIKHLQRLGKS